jgi:hypothetical protein
MSVSGRDNRGRFAKGNTYGEKDSSKDACKRAVKSELSYLVHLISDMPVKEIRKIDLENESLLTHAIIKKALKNDTNDLKWAMEMIAGKAIQQVEQNNTGNVGISLAYKATK